jgi:hypothetical protein
LAAGDYEAEEVEVDAGDLRTWAQPVLVWRALASMAPGGVEQPSEEEVVVWRLDTVMSPPCSVMQQRPEWRDVWGGRRQKVRTWKRNGLRGKDGEMGEEGIERGGGRGGRGTRREKETVVRISTIDRFEVGAV